MSKKTLVDEVLDDALQVRETALANAKLALEEAFEPRIKSMISRHLQTEMEDEDEMDDVEDMDDEMEDMEEAEDMEDDMEDMEDDMENMGEAEDMEDEEADDMRYEEDLDLESIIAELESDLDDEEEMDLDDEERMGEADEFEMEEAEDMGDEEDDEYTNEVDDEDDQKEIDIEELFSELAEEDEEDDDEDEGKIDIEELFSELAEEDEEDDDEDEEEIDIEELFAELAEEEEEEESKPKKKKATKKDSVNERRMANRNRKLSSQLKEHREAIKILRKKLNEVNLLNAKLLYTTKLFRKYNLNNSQKIRVVESFDRTKTVRETKLVYSTIAESLNFGTTSPKSNGRVKSITEGFASKPTTSTKPVQREIISEGNDVVNRFKRLVTYNK